MFYDTIFSQIGLIRELCVFKNKQTSSLSHDLFGSLICRLIVYMAYYDQSPVYVILKKLTNLNLVALLR